MKRLFFVLLLGVLLVGFGSAALFTNTVSTCSAEDKAAKESFGGVCDDTTGSFLINDDVSLETHTYSKNSYGGIRVQSVNSSITDCIAVTQVFVCYKWWRTDTATPQDCDISVDANGGASYSAVSTTCPAISEPASITCTNVTGSEIWGCGNFFGASGVRALAKSEISRIGTGAGTTETGIWDVMYFNVTYSANVAPVVANLTSSHSLIKGGDTITIYANTTSNGVDDSNVDILQLFCASGVLPTAANTDCTGGTTSGSYPYNLSCTFPTVATSTNYTEYCRVYDGVSYSSVVPNITYTTDSIPPTTSIVSVAGDSVASYFDMVNDGVTKIIVSGEASMSCRWSSSDVAYSSMSNACTVSGVQANCSVSDVASQGFNTRYVSCQDNYTNGQNATQNLNVQFFLDYTSPTTSDNSVSTIQVPNYTVTITEADNVDADPTTLYCTDSVGTCMPSASIDDDGQVIFTSANRGINYLRYNSSDDAGNVQVVQNKTININQLPVFVSASDNVIIIRGGDTVNVSTVSYDSDVTQLISLFVCNSSGVNSSGCIGTEYCSASGSSNLTCAFVSELDSSSHTWYAYVFDQLGEAASNNTLTGTYTTDVTSPVITLIAPINGSTITQESVTFTVSGNEVLSSAWYSLDGGVTNVTMTNISMNVYTHTNSSITPDGTYNMTFWANDSYGNEGILIGNWFVIDATADDVTAPTVTVQRPINGSYNLDGSVLLNITTNEALSWAGYANDSGVLTNLGNVSLTSWNATVSFVEGVHDIIFYANDSSSNQGNSLVTVYVDLTVPAVSNFSCMDVNDSVDVICNVNVSDAVGLDYVIVGHNATGTWVNSSDIDLSGVLNSTNYIIGSGNHSPVGFSSRLYVYDLSGRVNSTSVDSIVISDDTFPIIGNIIYAPNSSDDLDPGVAVNVNASVTEDYDISSVVLMYKNSTATDWNFVSMSNNSVLITGASSTVVYNGSFVPTSDDWIFKINTTDSTGNVNVSENITIIVENDTSHDVSTTIDSVVSLVYADRASNNSLGNLILNNTGDVDLNFSVSLVSVSLASRLSVNYSGNLSVDYSVGSGGFANIAIDVNTTGLISGLYSYNVTVVSEAGTEVFERQLNLQTAAGPYLSVDIGTYSSSVIAGSSGADLVATVTNLGTADATDVYLTWTLPSAFSVTSGSLVRNLGALPIGGSGSNSLVVSVSSSAIDSDTSILAVANSSNADLVNSSKDVTIGAGAVATTITIIGGGGGSMGSSSGGGGEEFLVYSKVVEIVRGKEDKFEIEVDNIYINSTLEDLTMTLTGFLSQYIKISPLIIDSVEYGESGKFNVSVQIPSYKEDYERYTLVAVINGHLVSSDGISRDHKETQNILLIIQETGFEETNLSLVEAEKAISEMKIAGFNTIQAESALIEARLMLDERKNAEAFALAKSILEMRDLAFKTQNLIDGVFESLRNPVKMGILTGNAVKDAYSDDSIRAGMNSVFTGWAIFGDKSVEDILNLAKAAFNRGDYSLASERVKEAQNLLLLNRKGNFGLFLFLYWPFIFVSVFFVSFGGIVGYRKYQRSVASARVVDINREEENIRELMIASQQKYFTGAISSGEYHRIMNQHEKKLVNLKTARLILRNRRVQLLKPQQIILELESEKSQTEGEVKKLQTDYYEDKKIGAESYELQFRILNERLAEIEGERMTALLMRDKGKKISPKRDKDDAWIKGKIKKKVIYENKSGSEKKVVFRKGVHGRRVKMKRGKNEK